MISLKEYLAEGILDIEDKLDKDYIKTQIEDFIKENYKGTGELKINLIKDKYIVNCNKRVEVKNKNIKSLTNVFFEWGEVNGFFSCSYCDKLQSLEGSPKKVGGSFRCKNCGEQFTVEDVKEVCKVKGSIQI